MSITISLAFLYAAIMSFSALAGFSNKRPTIQPFFTALTGISVVVLIVYVIFCDVPFGMISILAMTMAVIESYVFYALATEVVIIREEGRFYDAEQSRIGMIIMMVGAIAIIVGIILTIIALEGSVTPTAAT